MQAPVILTAADVKFKELVEVSVRLVEKFGYTSLVYDLGKLGIGKPYKSPTPLFTKYDESKPETDVVKVTIPGKHGPWEMEKTNRKALGLFKPHCLLDAMNTTKDWEWMMWLDADAFIVKPIDEMFEGEYDVGVTIRDSLAKKKGNRFLNSGVVVVRNTENAHRFVQQWIAEQGQDPYGPVNPDDESGIHDQASLHEVFYRWSTPLYPTFVYHTVTVGGVKVKCFPWKTYNRTFTGRKKWSTIQKENTAKIWHMQKAYFPQQERARSLVLRALEKI